MVRALILAVLAFSPSARAADPALPQSLPHQSLGVASCASSLCHGSVHEWAGSRVRQNEYLTWSREDPHARSYAKLTSERSAQIVRRLGLRQPATEVAACLDCHVHNAPRERRGNGFQLSDGISCEACHGPAERWLTSHVQPDA